MATDLQLKLVSVYLALATIAVGLNLLLIFVALRLPKRKREINFTLVVASVDLVVALVAIVATSTLLLTGNNLEGIPGACQIKGPVDYFGLYFSMQFVFLVAYERYNRIMNKRCPRGIQGLIGFYTTVYCFLVIAASLREEYHLLGNGIDCAPIASFSGLSATLTFFHGFSLLMFMLLTVGCYMRILLVVLPDSNQLDNAIEIQDRAAIELRSQKSTKIPRMRHRKVALRTIIICLTYFIIIAPACLLLLVEAIIPQEDSIIVGVIIDFCLASVAVVNPCLVLFAHSLIYSQLTSLFN